MSTAPFTEVERTRIKKQLSYANWANISPSFNLGVPQGNQFSYLVDTTFDRITPDARALVRQDLERCECTEAQIFGAQERLQASQLGEIKMNPQEIPALKESLNYWRKSLADDLGVWQQPYSIVVGDQLLEGGIGGKVGR